MPRGLRLSVAGLVTVLVLAACTTSSLPVADDESSAPPGDRTSAPPSPPHQTPDPVQPTESPVRFHYPGQPAPGLVYWGSSVPGNADPEPRFELPTGQPLSLRRSYFQWEQRTTDLIDVAERDLQEGRLPWVSVKTPFWSSMAAGEHDIEIDDMLRRLSRLEGPIWLTVHHEPEGGNGTPDADDPGGGASHVAMNRRVRERIDSLGIDNLALAPVLMGWTFREESGRDPNDWWADGIYDFLGVDIYVFEGDEGERDPWQVVLDFAAEHGVDVAVGEWGIQEKDGDEEMLSDWFNEAASSAFRSGPRVTALTYWDNAGKTGTPYRLSGSRLEIFLDVMQDPRVARWEETWGATGRTSPTLSGG